MPFEIRFSVRLAVVLVIAALILAACGGEDDSSAGGVDTPNTATPTASDVTPTGRDAGAATPSMEEESASPTMDHGMGESGTMTDADPDLLFIDGMIVHHASAIAMAEVAQEAAEHYEIKQLADEIIAAQQQEIEQMEQWRSEWYPDAPESDLSGMMDMAGMAMSEADMQMRDAVEFDKQFIDMMILHHESAIEMARALQDTTGRPELQELTKNIVKTQQAEIDQMREWRDAWYGAS